MTTTAAGPILAIDLGKDKCVACLYDRAGGGPRPPCARRHPHQSPGRKNSTGLDFRRIIDGA
jgi:hypothetical protein